MDGAAQCVACHQTAFARVCGVSPKHRVQTLRTRVQAQRAGMFRRGAQHALEQTEHAVHGGGIGCAGKQRAGLGERPLRRGRQCRVGARNRRRRQSRRDLDEQTFASEGGIAECDALFPTLAADLGADWLAIAQRQADVNRFLSLARRSAGDQCTGQQFAQNSQLGRIGRGKAHRIVDIDDQQWTRY